MQFGARVPALWIGEGGFNHITVALDNNPNYAFNLNEPGEKFNTDSWVNVKLSQIDGVYEYKINNKVLHQKVNSNPQIWRNVKVVMGNRYGNPNSDSGLQSAIGEYRNFRITSPDTDSPQSKKILESN